MKKLKVKIRRAWYGVLGFCVVKTIEDNVSFSWQNIRRCALWLRGFVLKTCESISKVWEQISPYVLYTVFAMIVGVVIYSFYQSFLKLRQYYYALLGAMVAVTIVLKVIETVAARQRGDGTPKA